MIPKMHEKTPRVSREPMTAQVVRALRSDIITGEFPPGHRLIEVSLAKRYGISRHVVREALQALEGEGLVVTDHFRGRSVIDPSPREVEGLLLMRISLESLMAALAAYKTTPEQSRMLAEKARLADKDSFDFAGLIEWDVGLHRAIWEIASEPVLNRHLEKLVWPMFESGSILELAPDSQERMVRDQWEREQTGHPAGHQAVVRAICEQNSPLAREAMIRHFLAAGTRNYSNETAAALAAAFPVTAPDARSAP